MSIVGTRAQGYTMMPQVEKTLRGYLSPGSTQEANAVQPCRTSSMLLERLFRLKDLSMSSGISEEAFSEVHRPTDLTLHLSKQIYHGCYVGVCSGDNICNNC